MGLSQASTLGGLGGAKSVNRIDQKLRKAILIATEVCPAPRLVPSACCCVDAAIPLL